MVGLTTNPILHAVTRVIKAQCESRWGWAALPQVLSFYRVFEYWNHRVVLQSQHTAGRRAVVLRHHFTLLHMARGGLRTGGVG